MRAYARAHVCVCTRVILQFQENISTSRENKIYNENKVEGKNKIDDAEMKFIRKLRIAKAPARKCHETKFRVINVLSLQFSLEVTIRHEISQSSMRILISYLIKFHDFSYVVETFAAYNFPNFRARISLSISF